MKGFRSLESSDVERVVFALLAEATLAFFQGGAEEGIAVGGQRDFPGTEVEGDDADVLHRDGETVNHAIAYVLLAHSFYHAGDDDLSGHIVAPKLVRGMPFGQQTLGFLGAQGCQLGLVGLRVVVEYRVEGRGARGKRGDEALAVANHPYLAVQAAEDDRRTGQAVFGMLSQPLQYGLFIVFADIGSNTSHKLLARSGLRHTVDIARSQLHGITTVGAQQAVAVVALRGAAVDDGDEVICDDDGVLAFLLGVLRDEALFDDFHVVRGLCTRRNSRAGPASPAVCGR